MTEITILSGTRDELGGIDLGVANVYERPEKSGNLSALLVLPDRELVVTIGDEVTLGSRTFRLTAISEHHTGAHSLHFSPADRPPTPPPPKPRAQPRPIAAIAPMDLVIHLRKITPRILSLLNPDSPVPAISEWKSESKNSMVTEWNGMQSGPTTHHLALATFGPGALEGLEARIDRDVIRYGPDEIYRVEVSAHWKNAGRTAHIFARAEGEKPLTEIWSNDLPAPILALIRMAD